MPLPWPIMHYMYTLWLEVCDHLTPDYLTPDHHANILQMFIYLLIPKSKTNFSHYGFTFKARL